jgi:hypothetical protein
MDETERALLESGIVVSLCLLLGGLTLLIQWVIASSSPWLN